ncbi:MAG TPA: SDR family NAD(P)-dependent oxidoreductase [Acidimicrobiales bacterium]|nr:SDR family NAD(P)-dependent oxidoreductase [Acidimicrobiales bacterium]
MEHLRGKVAVVTGAASGIGFALAERFLAEGMPVAMADIEEAALHDAAARLRATGGELIEVAADVADPAQVEALAEATERRFGAVHVVCNNAGVGVSGAVWETSEADWQWVLGVNLWGQINGIRTFVPRLIAAGEGHIVNTASLGGLVPFAGSPAYSVSKFAAVALSEILYLQLKAAGAPVGVTMLCPGWVRTRLAEARRNRPARDGGSSSLPPVAQRIGRSLHRVLQAGMDPAEVAAKVVDAIRQDRFYVLTHDSDEWVEPIRRRSEAIVAGSNPLAPVVPGIEAIMAALAEPD